jgi:hypothetical protein
MPPPTLSGLHHLTCPVEDLDCDVMSHAGRHS